jgi:hypothetical protein
MIFILMLTMIHKSACSILNVMKVTKLNLTLNLQSFEVKPCAVAIYG